MVSTRVIRGPGFSFSSPSGWKATRTAAFARVDRGEKRISVVVYPLLKPYRPALFAAASKELDRVASQLAAKDGLTLSRRETTTVDGRKVRAYRFGTTRIGFVLVGKREYELLCELPPDGKDVDGACALLFSSFRAA